jgi:hypothetical protein
LRGIIFSQQFDHVIKALEEGKEIDLSQMPPPPQGIAGNTQISILLILIYLAL